MLFENEQEVFLCQNCDSEFTVTKIDDEEDPVAFCPYCGEPVDQIDEDIDEDDLDEM